MSTIWRPLRRWKRTGIRTTIASPSRDTVRPADALHEAIKNYRDRKAGVAPAAKPEADLHEHDGCACPYCDSALEEEDKTFCRACRVEFEECPACGGITKKGDKTCLHCGAPLGAKG